MRLEINVESNGVHQNYRLSAIKVEAEHIPFLKEVAEITDKYEKKEVKSE